MKEIILTLLAATLLSSGYAQKKIDYLKVRDGLRPPLCGQRDEQSSAEVYAELLAVDTNTIRRNIAQYYLDLSEMEYLLYMYRMDTALLRKSAEHSAIAVTHDPNSAKGLWGAAFGFGHLGDCERMNFYLMAYIARVPLRYRTSDEQINRLIAQCGR